MVGSSKKRRISRRSANRSPSPIEEVHLASETITFRSAFAAFLLAAAAAAECPSFYTLAGRHQWSLSLQLLLSARNYSALLLGCGLVEVRNKAGGGKEVNVLVKEWNNFLHRYELRNMFTGDGVCERTAGHIYYDALKKANTRTKSINRQTSEGGRMHLLRIGRYEETEGICKATLEINDCRDPPTFCRSLLTAHRKLFSDIAPLISDVIFGNGDMPDVMSWVEMENMFGAPKSPPPVAEPEAANLKSDDGGSAIKSINPSQKQPSKSNAVEPVTPSPAKISQPITNLKEGDGEKLYKALSTFGGVCALDDGTSITFTERATTLMGKMNDLQRQYVETRDELLEEIREHNNVEVADDSTAAGIPPPVAAAGIPPPAASTGIPPPAATTGITPPTNDDMLKKFSLLATLALPILNRPTANERNFDMGKICRENLLRQLTEYMDMVRQPKQCESMNSLWIKHFLRITTKKNDPSSPNIKEGMDDLFNIGDAKKIVQSLLEYLLRHHRTLLLEGLRDKRILPKKMDAYETAATLDHAKILPSQWKRLGHCLKAFLDIDKALWPTEKEVYDLGADCVMPVAGVYHHEHKEGEVKERIRFWHKSPSDAFVHSIECMVNGNHLDPNEIDWTAVCHGGDHATKDTGKYRFLAKSILKMKNDKIYMDIYSLADIQCKKDKFEILDATIMTPMMEGIDEIAQGKLIFQEKPTNNEEPNSDGPARLRGGGGTDDATDDSSDDTDNRIMSFAVELVMDVDESTSTGAIVNPTSYIAGDLKAEGQLVGRDDYETWWCMFCWLYKPDWQDKPCTCEQWVDIQKIIEQYNKNDAAGLYKKDSCKERMGVRRLPSLKKGTKLLAPGLHFFLGCGNMLMEYFFDTIDLRIQPIAREEHECRESIPENEVLLEQAKANLDIWKNSEDGGRALRRLKNESTGLGNQLTDSTLTAQSKAPLLSRKEDVDERIKAMESVVNNKKSNIKTLKRDIKNAKERLESYRKARKTNSASIYSGCEDILDSYNIKRGSHHGGEFNGVNIIGLMDEATDIIGKMKQFMIANGNVGSHDTINKLCADIASLLQAWNKIFARINESDPSPEFCDETQEEIDGVMKLMRNLGFSITPKLHGIECHLVHQMRNVPGFCHMLEQWIEKYHQDAHKMDLWWKMFGTREQGVLRAKRERRAQHPKTKIAKKKVESKFVGVRKRPRKATTTAKMNIKTEERDGGIEAVLDLLRKYEEESEGENDD